MTQFGSDYSCQTKCWGLAAVIGFITMILALSVGQYGWGTSIFLGLLTLVLLGLLLTWLMCSDLPKLGQSARAKEVSSGAGTAGAGSGSAMPAAAVVGATAAAKPSAKPAATAPTLAPAPAATETAAEKTEASATADTATAAETKADKAANAVDDAPKDQRSAAKASDAALVKPSAALAGEAELSSRKGSWKYEGTAKSDGAAASGTRDAEAAASEDYDGDGVLEGTDEGTKPETLDAARAGGADNLKEIKGIGPKLETMLNEMGFFHFDQVASWTADEVAWVNANLSGFKGRVSRDDWVEQAKILAAGGDTEFSKRVDKGDVY